MAQSLDGRVAGADGQPVKLSGPHDHERVHRLRASVDAVMVGVGTVLADDPRLTARPDGEVADQPVRVVADSRMRTPADARVLGEAAETVVLTTSEHGDSEVVGARVFAAGETRVEPELAVDALAELGIERVLVEGGPTLAASFLEAGVVDRFTLYIAPRVLGEGPSLAEAFEGLDVDLQPRSRGPIGEGTLVCYGVEA